MNLTSNPATIAYLCLEIDIKLILRFKIENIQHGVFAEKVGGFDFLKLLFVARFSSRRSAGKESQQKT